MVFRPISRSSTVNGIGWCPAVLIRPHIAVTIPEVEPARPIRAQHAPHLAEDGDQRGDVGFRGRLEAELRVDPAGVALAADLSKHEHATGR
jgi:hypothetical protein